MQEQKEKRSALFEVLALCGMALFNVIMVMLKVVGFIAEKAVDAIDARVNQSTSDKAKLDIALKGAVPSGPSFAKEFEVGARQIGVASSTDFDVADRIIGLRLEPAVGTVHLRVYYDKRIVKRELIIVEPKLRSIMQGRRHSLPDVAYNPDEGLRRIKEESAKLAEDLINRVGGKNVKPASRVAAAPAEQKPQAKQELAAKKDVAQKSPEVKPVVAKSEDVKVKPQAPQIYIPKDVPQVGKRFDARPTKDVTFEGILVKAEVRQMTPKGRDPYETFEARILLENGVEMPMRGLELERELANCGVHIGNRVAITPKGKVPVTLANGKEGEKNMYHVVRLGGH